jgi:hypothetical protein
MTLRIIIILKENLINFKIKIRKTNKILILIIKNSTKNLMNIFLNLKEMNSMFIYTTLKSIKNSLNGLLIQKLKLLYNNKEISLS